MSDKNKKIRNLLSDFFSYHRDELSGKGRNSLEREFQKDPFTEEAAEGYRSLKQQEAMKDITELQNIIKKRTVRRSVFIYYRIAASIAILIAVSAIFFLIVKSNQPKQLAENSIQSPKSLPANNQTASEPVSKEIISKEPTGKAEKKSVRPIVPKSVPEQGRSSGIISEPLLAENRKVDSIPSPNMAPPEIYAADKRLSAPTRAMSKDRSLSLYSIKGKVISSEDNLPVPGVTILIKGAKAGAVTDIEGNFSIAIPDSTRKILVANFIGMESKEFQAKSDEQVEVRLDPSLTSLSEVVVVGYGVSKEEVDSREDDNAIIPPQPSTGKANFNKYIQSNLHRPDSSTAGQRAVVVLNIHVKTDGSIDSISVIRSPGKLFSDEAIRVIKSGPSWKPALENGKAVEDNVRIRIVFR
jgi:TonB family protein